MERGGNCADSKEGGRKKGGNYRGVTLMPTLYKVYTSMLVEKLREKLEEKGIILQT